MKSLHKEVLRLAVPSILANITVPLVGMVDIAIAGHISDASAIGGIAISALMTALFRRFYTATFSVVFGLFLSMIPNMLNESCVLGMNPESALSVLLIFLGFAVSFYLGNFHAHNARIRARFSKPPTDPKKE